jgi:hypothetical protein
MEFLWECMVLSLKAVLGTFFWSIAIGAGSAVLAIIFALINSIIFKK